MIIYSYMGEVGRNMSPRLAGDLRVKKSRRQKIGSAISAPVLTD